VNKIYDKLPVSKELPREEVKGSLEMESGTGNLPDRIASPFQSEFHCSIGIMAYNEAANIAKALRAVLEQRTTTCKIDEILVVASGCTDCTEAIVLEFCKEYPLIRLITQATREGKASAVNVFLNNVKSDILVLVGADTIPGPDSIQRVIEPFIDPDVGMTGGHPIPLNDPQTFMGFAVHLLWELHHQVALRTPKMGELLAFRRIFQRIPFMSAVDDAAMEPLVFGQGYRLVYVPEAFVKNRGPQTFKDFLKQRRRIYAGHLSMRQTKGYRAATVSTRHILLALLHAWQWNWRFLFWTPAVIVLEAYGRFLGWVDYKYKKKSHAIWDRIDTTKVL
jgi:cellulose synthase/poly-beta-1,6-N-acetylglucosamine synthase-like glycosyltransferase